MRDDANNQASDIGRLSAIVLALVDAVFAIIGNLHAWKNDNILARHESQTARDSQSLAKGITRRDLTHPELTLQSLPCDLQF
ncbi:MAG: hypothetical protein QM501_04525 [Gimesia sp.]